MKRILDLILFCFVFALPAFAEPGEASGDAKIRAAVAHGNPIIIARVIDSRLILQGTRSQQLDYDIEVLHVLSGQRAPWCKTVAHWSNDSLKLHQWNKGGTYLFIFDRPDITMPSYYEPLSRFGKRKAQVINLVDQLKNSASAAKKGESDR